MRTRELERVDLFNKGDVGHNEFAMTQHPYYECASSFKAEDIYLNNLWNRLKANGDV
jgi:hypothetical protein